MKSRRFKKSRTAARKCNGSKKRGRMFRRAFREIIGKNPIEKLDKAKQLADAVAKGMATQSQSTPITQGKTRTFSTPPEIMRINIESMNVRSNSPTENAYKTPVKMGKDRINESTLSKVRRHHSRSVTTPQSYAPTMYDPTSVVTGNLFADD